MNYERYPHLEISKDELEYKFISLGPYGAIQKVIQFKVTLVPDTYNLAFGDIKYCGGLDDLAKGNNKDRNKILATVAFAVYEFTRKNPAATVFITGSTPGRTRLYRMAIAIYYKELNIDFEIFGVRLTANGYIDEPFTKGVGYYGFLVKTKNFILDYGQEN